MNNWSRYFEIDEKYPTNEEHSENKNKILKFIFLWMKCNEYYNNKYNNICGDKNKFLELKENLSVQNAYKQYSIGFLEKFGEIIPSRKPKCYVINMKNQDKKVYYHIQKKRRLEDLLKVIYQIRCNLFHGEKEPNSEDIKFVCWAYDCLSQLLEGVID